MISEVILVNDKPEFVRFRAVAVKDYGSEGCMPLHADDCPHGQEISCVSGSGDSICGGYYGHAGNHVVKCQEEMQ
jgi:hypothetical protein